MSMFKVEDQITTTGFLLQRPFHIFQRPQPYRSFWWRQFGKYFHPPWPLSDRAEVVICVSEANCNIYLGLAGALTRTWQGNSYLLLYIRCYTKGMVLSFETGDGIICTSLLQSPDLRNKEILSPPNTTSNFYHLYKSSQGSMVSNHRNMNKEEPKQLPKAKIDREGGRNKLQKISHFKQVVPSLQ